MADGMGPFEHLARMCRTTGIVVALALASAPVLSQSGTGALLAPDLASAYPAARLAVAAYYDRYRDDVPVTGVVIPLEAYEPVFFIGAFLRRFTAFPTLAEEAAPLCAYTAGAGGTLQIDGGGGRLHLDGGGGQLQIDGGGGQLQIDGGGALLQVRDPSVFGFATVVQPFGLVSPAALRTDHVVIIDTFDLDAIERAIRALDGDSWSRTTSWHQTWQGAVTTATLLAGGALMPPDVGRGWHVPHGHVVLYHLLAAASGDGRFVGVERLRGSSSMTLMVQLEDARLFRIDLRAIAYGNMDTVSDAMRYAADATRSDAAVVTSWGLTDCALRDAYVRDRGGAESLAEYLRDAIVDDGVLEPYEGEPSGGLLAQLCAAFAAFMPQHASFDCSDDVAVIAALAVLEQRAARAVGWPLFDADEAGRGTMPYHRVFASAGNQRLPFPLPPAAWPGVYGVAACEGPATDAPMAWYSNVGDFVAGEHVVARGSWFPVRVPDAPAVGYWGTSYAAPVAALAIGLEGTARGGAGIAGCAEPATP